MLKSKPIATNMLAIFIISERLSLILSCWSNFPQLRQKSFGGGVVQSWQGWDAGGFLINRSVVISRIRVPINMSTVAPMAWKTWSASWSP
jgi:hypothetical protein